MKEPYTDNALAEQEHLEQLDRSADALDEQGDAIEALLRKGRQCSDA